MATAREARASASPPAGRARRAQRANSARRSAAEVHKYKVLINMLYIKKVVIDSSFSEVSEVLKGRHGINSRPTT